MPGPPFTNTLAIPAIGDKVTKVNEQSIRIGGLGPLTLPGLSWAGHELSDGMTLAVEHINNSGGVLGRPLALSFEDTQGRPQAGVAAVDKLLGEGIHAFVGEFHSVVADAVVELIQRSGLPFVCASATMDSVTARRLSVVFRLAPPQSHGWSIYADYLASHGFRHVVALQEDNVYWNSGSRVIEARLHSMGVRFTQIPVTSGPMDAAEYTRKVLDMRVAPPAPDFLLMLVAYPEPFASLAGEARRHGLAPPACFLGDPAGRVAFPDWRGAAGMDSTRIPFLSYTRPRHPTEKGLSISKDFKNRFGRDPTFVACEGYDSVLVFARACADAGTAEPGAVCNALRKISVAGTRGAIRFSTERDGVVHQQWKWPPVCVVAYSQPQQTFAEAELLWDAEHGRSGQPRPLRGAG